MYEIKPIGKIRNDVKNRSEIFTPGVKSSIEIYPEYVSALEAIETNSHIIVLCFMNQARRNTLKVHPRKFNICLLEEAGVFATRSPDRPNPVSFSVVRLISKKENILEIDSIDSIDNTPVIDIKPYIIAMDGIFNAQRTNYSDRYNISDINKLHTHFKDCIKNYPFFLDGSEDVAISCIITFIEKYQKMPDRFIIDYLETDFTGSALDTLYYFTKFTPGENKIRLSSENTTNSILRFFLSNGEVVNIKKSNTDKYLCIAEK